jgi:Innexin
MILSLCTFSVLSVEFFIRPISCVGGNVTSMVLENYCWIHAIFTYFKSPENVSESYHPFMYQYSFIYLILQAISLYVPHYIWKRLEGRKMKILIEFF